MGQIIELWPPRRQRDDAAAYMQRVSEHEQRPIIAPLEPPADYSDEAAAAYGMELAALCFFCFGLGCLATALAALVLSRFM